MSNAILRNVLVVVAVAGASVGLTLTAQAASKSTATVHGCLNKHTKQIQDVSISHAVKCPAHTSALSWNERGPAGATGSRGPAGATGPQGPAVYHVAGIVSATTCHGPNPTTSFTSTLVSTGSGAPYCKIALTTPPSAGAPVVTAIVDGGTSPEFVEEQDADRIDLQTWTTSGVNITGQAGAGLIEFAVTTGTG
jgi:hypothetical protein